MERKPRILLVDDEAAITSKLAPFLERAGFAVDVAGDGETALLRVASFAPDLIILDVLMPKLDGREVCRQLRAAGNWTPIIMLTQVGEATERAMALEEGADDYLNKPFDPQELVARMRAVLRRARPGAPPLAATQRLACAPFLLDRAARKVVYAGLEVTLTPAGCGFARLPDDAPRRAVEPRAAVGRGLGLGLPGRHARGRHAHRRAAQGSPR